MVKKGSLVRYVGRETKDAWHGKYMSVANRDGETVEVYKRNKKGKWETAAIALKDVEEVC